MENSNERDQKRLIGHHKGIRQKQAISYSFSLLFTCPIDKIKMSDHTIAPTFYQHRIQTKTTLPLKPPQKTPNKPKSNNEPLLACSSPCCTVSFLAKRKKILLYLTTSVVLSLLCMKSHKWKLICRREFNTLASRHLKA